METLVCGSVEEWLNRLADERESEGDILYVPNRENRTLGFQVGNRTTTITISRLQDKTLWWTSEESKAATWERLGVPEIMFTESCRRPRLRQLFLNVVARNAEPLYLCKTVGEWINCISPYFNQVDTDTHLGCKDPGTGTTFLLPRKIIPDVHSWFDTVGERDRLLERKCLTMAQIANLIRFPDEREKWFKGQQK